MWCYVLSLLAVVYVVPHDWWLCLLSGVPLGVQPRRRLAVQRLHVQCHTIRRCPGDKAIYVLALHGLLCSGRFWEPFVEQLRQAQSFHSKANVKVVCPDLVGFGRSPWLRNVHYTMDLHLRKLSEDVIERCIPSGVEFHLLGHSMGACIALELAKRFPTRVLSLSLLGSPYYTSQIPRQKMRDSQSFGAFFLRHPVLARVLCELFCSRRHVWHRVLPHLCFFNRFPRAVIQDYMKHTYESAVSSFDQIVLKYNPQPALNSVIQHGIALLAVHGAHDITCDKDTRVALWRDVLATHTESGSVHEDAAATNAIERTERAGGALRRVVAGAWMACVMSGAHDFPVRHPRQVTAIWAEFVNVGR